MRRIGPAPRLAFVAAALTVGALLASCAEPQTASAAPSAVEPPPIDLISPQAAATTVLGILRAERSAVARHDQPGAERCGELLLSAAATEVIRSEVEKQPHYRPLLGKDLVRGYTHYWGATVAYYLDGLNLSGAQVSPAAPDRAAVLIPATGRDGRPATLRIECYHDSQHTWRVARIEFERPQKPAGSQPTP